jgi:D-sedoheptulose 7-phosphate isomerase
VADPASLPVPVEELVAARLDDVRAVAGRLAEPNLLAATARVAEVFVGCYRDGGRVVLFGNGGSAADAAHVAAEFVGRCTRDRPPLPALALTEGLATVTAVGNDYGYEEVFARQLRAHARQGDVVVALSTSGRSPNVLRGLAEARALGLATVGLTGGDGGGFPGLVDHLLVAPSADTARIQEVHQTWCHIWVEAVEAALFG